MGEISGSAQKLNMPNMLVRLNEEVYRYLLNEFFQHLFNGCGRGNLNLDFGVHFIFWQ